MVGENISKHISFKEATQSATADKLGINNTTVGRVLKRNGIKVKRRSTEITKLEWQKLMQGSPIYRIGYDAWVRNVAVAIGNAPYDKMIIDILNQRLQEDLSDMVKEHLYWAKLEQLSKSNII